MITTPPTRRADARPPLVDPAAAVHPGRVVTPEQVERAVLQLRERPGQSAAEQVKAVLRALDLTVEAPVGIPDQR